MREDVARLKRDLAKTENEVKECLERNNHALRKSEEEMKRMMEDCARTIEIVKKGGKDMMDECKRNYEERERNEKSDSETRLAAAETASTTMMEKLSTLELSIMEMAEVQKRTGLKWLTLCLLRKLIVY